MRKLDELLQALWDLTAQEFQVRARLYRCVQTLGGQGARVFLNDFQSKLLGIVVFLVTLNSGQTRTLLDDLEKELKTKSWEKTAKGVKKCIINQIKQVRKLLAKYKDFPRTGSEWCIESSPWHKFMFQNQPVPWNRLDELVAKFEDTDFLVRILLLLSRLECV